jgi:hypothetical protein
MDEEKNVLDILFKNNLCRALLFVAVSLLALQLIVSYFFRTEIPYLAQVFIGAGCFLFAAYFTFKEDTFLDFSSKLALLHLLAVGAFCIFLSIPDQSFFFQFLYFAYFLYAVTVFLRALFVMVNERIERNAAHRKWESGERLTFSQYYRPKLGKLAETLAPIEAERATEPLRSTLKNILAQFSAIHLDPNDTTWRESDNVFLLATENVPLETLKAVPQKVFTAPDGTLNPEEVIRSLEKTIRNDRLTRAPAAGWHVYGLPHPNAEYMHESPHPEHYAVKPDDRFKHAYIIGKTGAGKTTLLRNLILQDITRGDGVIVLSPESGLFDFLLEYYPEHRQDDLIYYDPTDDQPPIISLNPVALEDRRQLAAEAGAVAATLARALSEDLSGAMHNLLLESTSTLLQLPDTSFQDLRALLKPVSPLRQTLPTHPNLDETTREYWRDEYEKGSYTKKSAEALLSRLKAFFMPPLRLTIATASFPFHEALNARRSVFFFDLSRIHGNQETLIGQLILSHLLQTLLKRDAEPEPDRVPYHLYVDEFQNYAEHNDSVFRNMFDRARKYRMSVTLAHQVAADIPEKLLKVILGNVGTKVCMRLAPTDAEFFSRQINVGSFDRQRHEAAQYLERLNDGGAFITTPTRHDALKIQVSQEPLLSEGANGREAITQLKTYSKHRYGKTPAPTSSPPKPPQGKPPQGNEGAEFEID